MESDRHKYKREVREYKERKRMARETALQLGLISQEELKARDYWPDGGLFRKKWPRIQWQAMSSKVDTVLEGMEWGVDIRGFMTLKELDDYSLLCAKGFVEGDWGAGAAKSTRHRISDKEGQYLAACRKARHFITHPGMTEAEYQRILSMPEPSATIGV